MKYRVTHTTKYEYTDTVPFCQNIVLLTPRVTEWQEVARHRLTIHPRPATNQRRVDYFGNSVHSVSVDSGHKVLQVTAGSTVTLHPREVSESNQSTPWEDVCQELRQHQNVKALRHLFFAFPSTHVPVHPELREYARSSFPSGRRIMDAVHDLNQRIYTDFQYDPTATTVSTPITEVFETRRGVCQDLAHLMLSGLRSLGLAARYISGYLRTHPPEGQERLVGADASHAWVSVYCGRDGWIDFDPTNGTIPSDEHIWLAWGRDFSDVCPVSGMFVGGGQQTLTVSVDVAPVGDSKSPSNAM